VKKALLSLAVAGLAFSAAQTTFAAIANPTQPMSTFTRGNFSVFEAYPVTAQPLTAANNVIPNAPSASDNATFRGQTAQDAVAGANVLAVPGVLSLLTINPRTQAGVAQRLNAAAFAAAPNVNYGSCVVQSYRLTKKPAVSKKCPTTFPGAGTTGLIQFGQGVRTWWSLIFTPPGTTFQLDVTTTCQGRDTASGLTDIHIDRYIWTVKVTYNSLRWVIDVLHAGALGTSEIPCIAAEDMYAALRQAVANIEAAATQSLKQDALFQMEALLIGFSAFGDCFFTDMFWPVSFPPSNDMQAGAFGWTGVIDTLENPCACKLLVDIEKLGEDFGITSI